MPWPGLFFKAMMAERLVLLDDVQFPRGGSWVNRNRLKNDQGELWLTVPVWKRGRSFQKIDQVEICSEGNWQRKHLFSLEHAYNHAPYWDEYGGLYRDIYQNHWRELLSLNLAILDCMRVALGINEPFLRNSTLATAAQGSQRLVSICKTLGAGGYLTLASSHKYLDEDLFNRNGIKIIYYKYQPPVYPQLWGNFIANLSALDLLLTCGPKSAGIILKAGWLI